MATNMDEVVRKTFTKTTLVTDCFHIQKLVYDAVEEMRIAYRWETAPCRRSLRRMEK